MNVRLVVLFSLASLFIGCVSPSAGREEPGREPVVLRLTWSLKAEHAPLLLAVDRGFFAAEGLDVEIAEGAGVNATLALLAEGKEAVAYGSAEGAVIGIDKGMPLQVIAVYGREVPWAIAARPGISLASPRDLEGRRLAVAAGGTFEAILSAWAAQEGVDLEQVALVRVDEATKAAQLLSGRVDAAAVYTNNQVPAWEKQAGVKLSILRLSDYGLRLPGAALISSRTVASEQPDLLRKLVRGINKGFAHAAAHPDEAADAVARRLPVQVDPDVLIAQITATIALLPDVANGEPSGRLSEADWEGALDLLHRTGLIGNREPVTAYYDPLFLVQPAVR